MSRLSASSHVLSAKYSSNAKHLISARGLARIKLKAEHAHKSPAKGSEPDPDTPTPLYPLGPDLDRRMLGSRHCAVVHVLSANHTSNAKHLISVGT